VGTAVWTEAFQVRCLLFWVCIFLFFCFASEIERDWITTAVWTEAFQVRCAACEGAVLFAYEVILR
jgi:hypothetical protein